MYYLYYYSISTINYYNYRVEESESVVGQSTPDILCTLCEEAKANLEFGPCGHVIMCAKCGERIKKCLECKQIVESRKIIDNDPQVHLLFFLYLSTTIFISYFSGKHAIKVEERFTDIPVLLTYLYLCRCV